MKRWLYTLAVLWVPGVEAGPLQHGQPANAVEDFGEREEAPALSSLTTRRLIERLERLEQVCLAGAPSSQRSLEPRVRARFERIGAVLSERARAAGMLVVEASSKKAVERWDASAWLKSLKSLSDSDRAERLELAYGVAVFRLATLTPSRKICDDDDLFCKRGHEDKALRKDLVRAKWEMRYLRAVPKDLVPLTNDFVRRLMNESEKRYKFLSDEVPGEHLSRRPLGIAYGMCGRPMSGHYDDDRIQKRADGAADPGHVFLDAHDSAEKIELMLDRVERGF